MAKFLKRNEASSSEDATQTEKTQMVSLKDVSF